MGDTGDAICSARWQLGELRTVQRLRSDAATKEAFVRSEIGPDAECYSGFMAEIPQEEIV